MTVLDPHGLPRKRTCAAMLLIGAALGATIGTIDRARGVPPSADRIFTDTPAVPPTPLAVGDTGHRPGTVHVGAVAFQGGRS